MNIGNALYTVFIGPLKLLFEVIYTLAYFLSNNAGLSIIALSIVMNVLLLPLYKRADSVQEEENKVQAKLKLGVDHIKKSFKGDEQYMVLNTYYRQNNYKPLYALRSSISLLLQIPFFIAAYDFLSNEHTVLSSSFGPIASLGSPDGLLGGINVLPILMTLINIVSSMIYTKGQPVKAKVQLYVMALAFLVFLYNRPSGLVFYWTLNNIFSLIKNIISRIKNSKFVLAVLCSSISVIGIIYVVIRPLSTITIEIGMILILLVLQLPLLLYLFRRKIKDFSVVDIHDSMFYFEIMFLCVMLGLFIPGQVIASSPEEFLDAIKLVNPLVYIFNTLLLSIGTFFVWTNLFYKLMNNNIKKYIQIVLFVVCVIATTNYLFFGRDLGTMSNLLVYDDGIAFTTSQHLFNIFVTVLVVVITTTIFIFKNKYVKPILIIAIITMSIVSSVNVFKINSSIDKAIDAVNQSKVQKATIELSKNGKNVVVIILDRAINTYFPYIMNEKPELQKTYAGFVYYPNTVSFGRSTNLGIPAVYGGYEYTPEEMDKRSDEYIPDKHTEALKVMPVLFDNNGYNVTVFDPCYANYRYPSDLSIFDEYTNIKKYNTEIGMFEYDKDMVKNDLETLNRNLFCFGITKSAPTIIQNILYNAGAYNSVEQYEIMYSETQKSNMSFQKYVKQGFARTYAVIENMISITDIKNDDSDNMLLMYNGVTHEPTLMQEPDYEMKTDVDNLQYDLENDYSRYTDDGSKIQFSSYDQISHYHINMKSLMELGKWFDYLKENNVYDNTRIIIVADHGYDLGQFDDMIFTYQDGETVDLMYYNPLLLYKDFNSDSLITDSQLMSNADVPYLAVKDVIDNPVNPFTNKLISDDMKHSGSLHIFMSDNYFVHINNGKTFIPGKWLYVRDNIFDLNNWSE